MEGYVYILRVSSRELGDSEALKVCTGLMSGRPNELYHLDILVGNPSRDLLTREARGQRLRGGRRKERSPVPMPH
jgi:hypothetical protein